MPDFGLLWTIVYGPQVSCEIDNRDKIVDCDGTAATWFNTDPAGSLGGNNHWFNTINGYYRIELSNFNHRDSLKGIYRTPYVSAASRISFHDLLPNKHYYLEAYMYGHHQGTVNCKK